MPKLTFSQRKGLKPMPTAQTKEWDDATTIEVWDAIADFVKTGIYDSAVQKFVNASLCTINMELLNMSKYAFNGIYGSMYHSAIELLNDSVYRACYFKASWNDRLDFIEYFVTGDGTPAMVADVSNRLNAAFEKRQVAYRIVHGEITDIDSEAERATVEEAGRESSHIVKAAGLLYDRENPDYANSIKESICAVEKICREITDKPKATLADCLRVIESKAPMHSALKDALTKLYGYASDEDGIRHAGFSGGEVGHAEAKFMLVACSAFCNFLREKQTQQ